MTHPQTIRLGKTEYVILPKAEYLRLQSLAGVPAGSVERSNTPARRSDPR